MTAVSERKTVADYIRERDQADYMPILKEPDSFVAFSAPRIYVDWYEGESPYLHISQEPETKMDEEVPPPVQQELIEDDFWSDNEVEEEVGLIEEDEKKAHVPSWEEEFGDELVGLPVLEEEGEFDPVGDLVYLEKLLEGKPTMEIKNSPNEDEQVNEEFDSWPVGEVDVGLTLKPRTREKARRKRLDQPILRVQRWFKQKKKLKYRNN